MPEICAWWKWKESGTDRFDWRKVWGSQSRITWQQYESLVGCVNPLYQSSDSHFCLLFLFFSCLFLSSFFFFFLCTFCLLTLSSHSPFLPPLPFFTFHIMSATHQKAAPPKRKETYLFRHIVKTSSKTQSSPISEGILSPAHSSSSR